MFDHTKDEAIRLAVRMHRHKEVLEEHPEPIASIRGDFLVIAQGSEVILLTKKQLFNLKLLDIVLKFSNGS